MALIRRSVRSSLAPAGGPAAGSGRGAEKGAHGESTTCIRCGAPLPPLGRRRQNVCRVCATLRAQTYLRDALANRRRRVHPDPEGVTPAAT